MAVYKRQTIVRVNEGIYEKMHFLAFKERRTVNEQVEHALKHYIEEYEKQHGALPVNLEEGM